MSLHEDQIVFTFLPYFPDTTRGVLPIPLVGGHDELHLIALYQHVAPLDFSHVEE